MRRRGNWKIRIAIGLCIVAFAFWKKCMNTETNPYTGKEQVISMNSDEEIAIGLSSKAQMIQIYKGIYLDQELQDYVDMVGEDLVNKMKLPVDHPYKFEFYLLGDTETINAFALPGGQVFITYALFSKLENIDQLAGVLGHEIGHVLGRHSAERIAETEFWQTVSQGASVGADAGGIVAGIGQNVLLGNGRGDELESDELGVRFMMDAGYDPFEMIGVMEILKKAAGASSVPEFQSTHPDPDNRIEKIKEAIENYKNN